MGKLKDKIKEIFYDEEELELLNTKIGDLKDQCDDKDKIIYYQKLLIETQAETIKTQRLEISKIGDLEKKLTEMEGNKDEKSKNTKRKSARLSKNI